MFDWLAERRSALSPTLTAIALVSALSMLGACVQNAAVGDPSAGGTGGKDGAGKKTAAVNPTAARFTDIPIPADATTNNDKTLVFGDPVWFGQVSLSTNSDPNRIFTFYKEQLPQFGWREITSIQAPISVLTYQREQRVLAIQIEDSTIIGSNVTLSMSPLREGAAAPGAKKGADKAAKQKPPANPAASRRARPIIKEFGKPKRGAAAPNPGRVTQVPQQLTQPELRPGAFGGAIRPAPPSLPPPPAAGTAPKPAPLFPGPGGTR